jgi:hypothetical protein
MANTKISALTSATTPLAGTEVLPIVQSSATVKVATNDLTVRNVRANATTGILQVTGPTAATTRVMTVPDANFTAARTDAAQSFTGDQTLSTGNLIQGTAAKGINFTANAALAGMTSQLLNFYEEGTWTPTNANVIVVNKAVYTRVGRLVTCNFSITAGVSGTSGNMGGLPFTPNGHASGVLSYQDVNGTETWSAMTTSTNSTSWAYWLGSTQKQLSAGKTAVGVFVYSV